MLRRMRKGKGRGARLGSGRGEVQEGKRKKRKRREGRRGREGKGRAWPQLLLLDPPVIHVD